MTHQVKWNHPNKGKITEEVCQKHLIELLGALRTLGIGCDGDLGETNICWRCTYDGHLFIDWMDRLNET